MTTLPDFLHALRRVELESTERAVAVLWWHDQHVPGASCSATTLARVIGEAGYGQQNSSRLDAALRRESRVSVSGKLFRIKVTHRDELTAAYGQYLGPVPPTPSDSVVPRALFTSTRGYLVRVVEQINASYDLGLYDCCAVMCRRLLETLIIEVYEANGWQDDLLGSDGHYMMFSGLLAVVEKDRRYKLGRNSLSGLRAFKRVGDLSAHNRRFNARQLDIQPLRDDIRVTAEELLHLAGLIK